VFRKDGTFVKGFVSKIRLAMDRHGRRVLNVRRSDTCSSPTAESHVTILTGLAPVGTVGSGGRLPGYFYGVGSVAVDSRGNLYGRNVQSKHPEVRARGAHD
jgi:hypothetical protein